MEENIEDKPTPIEPNVVVNVDRIPDWHPTLLEKSRKRDPILRIKKLSLSNRLLVKSSPIFNSTNIQNEFANNNNPSIENNNEITSTNNIEDPNNINIINNNNIEDMNDNSSESNSTNDSESSYIQWFNSRQKKSYSVPKNFERINLNDASPQESNSPGGDTKKRKEFHEENMEGDKNWALSPNLKNLEKQNTVWVDISCILHLPQKEASRVLGISGSLLCKRYKESTNNRKWPHRMMKKVKKEMNDPQSEEVEQKDPKLMRQLQRMKEHCMKPARIRLTRPVECHDDDYVLVSGPAKNTLILLPKNQASTFQPSQYQYNSPTRSNQEDSNLMVDDSNSEDYNF